MSSGLVDDLPAWGKIWVRAGKVICAMPLHPIDQFNAPPLLFIDETLDNKRNLFFVGALVFRSLSAIIATARHIQNLVVLAQAHKGFWLPSHEPPRLHLRELNHPAAWLKTPWKHVPRRDIEVLFRTFVPSIRELAVLKVISPIPLNSLRTVVSRTFPDHGDTQLQQLSIQLASIMLRTTLTDAHPVGDQLEIIADHDHTPVSLGKRRRQATLHLVDGLLGGMGDLPTKPRLIWNDRARYKSKFPKGFSWHTLEFDGFPIRPLVEAVGLQFVDIYLGIWRIINAEGHPYFGITSDDLGVQTISNMTWAYEPMR